VNKIRKGPEF